MQAAWLAAAVSLSGCGKTEQERTAMLNAQEAERYRREAGRLWATGKDASTLPSADGIKLPVAEAPDASPTLPPALPPIATQPLATLLPARPGPFGRAAALRRNISIAQANDLLHGVVQDPSGVFANVPPFAPCRQVDEATYDRFARMDIDGAGIALVFQEPDDPTNLYEFSIVVPSDAAGVLHKKWGEPSADGLWFDAAGNWQISTSSIECGPVTLPTIRFEKRKVLRAELLNREIPRWFGKPLTEALADLDIELTPEQTDTAEATAQMSGEFEFEASDGAVSGTIKTNQANAVVRVELAFATADREARRNLLRGLARLWGKPTVEFTDEGDIGLVFHKPGLKISGYQASDETWIVSVSR